MAGQRDAEGDRSRNLARQRQIYGDPLSIIIGPIREALGVSQAQIAQALGVSPPMLSQLVRGKRVSPGDPAVVYRIDLLRCRCKRRKKIPEREVRDLLRAVRVARPAWAAPTRRPGTPSAGAPAPSVRDAAEAFRGMSAQDLIAAAARIAGAYPEIAAVLRMAAQRPRR